MKQFFNVQISSPKKDDYPFIPFVRLVLVGSPFRGHDAIPLSPQLMTVTEIDDFVGGLQAELERFRADAKRALNRKRKVA